MHSRQQGTTAFNCELGLSSFDCLALKEAADAKFGRAQRGLRSPNLPMATFVWNISSTPQCHSELQLDWLDLISVNRQLLKLCLRLHQPHRQQQLLIQKLVSLDWFQLESCTSWDVWKHANAKSFRMIYLELSEVWFWWLALGLVQTTDWGWQWTGL